MKAYVYPMRRWGVFVLTLIFAICAGPRMVRAQADDAPAAPHGPIKVGLASVASMAELDKAATGIGMALPPPITVAGIEKMFTFIGPGGLDADRPVGIFFYTDPAGKAGSAASAVICLPVKPGVATVDIFQNKFNGQPVEGNPEEVSLRGAVFRRTTGYIMFGQSAAATSLAVESDLLDVYKPRRGESNPIFDTLVDVKAVRDQAPAQLDAFFRQIKANNPRPADSSERAGQEWAYQHMRLLDSARISLARAGADLELIMSISPLEGGVAGTFPRPQMPETVSVRVDSTAPKIIHSIDTGLDAIVEMEDSTNMITPQQKALYVEAKKSIDEALFDAGAISVGVVPAGKDTRVYLVQQRDAALDLAATMREAAGRMNTFAKAMDNPKNNEKTDIEYQEYDDAGQNVSRLQISEHDKPIAYIDAVEKGTTVYITGCADDGHHLGDITSLKNEGKMSGLLTGSIDLKSLFDEAVRDGAMTTMSADKVNAISGLVKGQILKFSTTGEGALITMKLDIPEGLLKGIVDMIMNPPGDDPGM